MSVHPEKKKTKRICNVDVLSCALLRCFLFLLYQSHAEHAQKCTYMYNLHVTSTPVPGEWLASSFRFCCTHEVASLCAVHIHLATPNCALTHNENVKEREWERNENGLDVYELVQTSIVVYWYYIFQYLQQISRCHQKRKMLNKLFGKWQIEAEK